MPKPLGSKKTGGRKKGTPNKRTLAFSDTLEARGVDLVGEILDIANGLPAREKIGIYLNLLPYQFPKRKPTEAPAPDFIEEHLLRLPDGKLKELHSDLSRRLGIRDPFEDMTDEEKEERRIQLREHLKQMIREEDELGGDEPD